jgi:hypothetical protein
MSATVHFSIKYDGPALADHQMDVRELAPALIALSNLLEEANKAAYPDSNEVRVQVKGNFKGGSFGVDFIALQTISQQIVTMLTGPQASAAANLSGILQGIGLIGGGTYGLIGLIKWLKGRKPISITKHGDMEIFEIRTLEEIETFEVDLVTGRLYRSRVVRQSLAKVLKPLERDGIDVFATGINGVTQNVVTKDELPSFIESAQEADVVSDTTTEGALLQVESAVFKDGNKWRFNDGATTFFAEITDRGFLERVESGSERFGKGDVLVVDLRRVQTITDNGLRLDYKVEWVRQHRAPLQSPLL